MIAALKDVAIVATEGKLKNAVGASRAAIAAGKEVGGKVMDDLLSEIGSLRKFGGGSSEEGHSGDAKNSTAPEPDNAEMAIDERKRKMAPGTSSECTQWGGSYNGQGRIGVVSHIQSKVAQLLHAQNGKCLRRPRPREQKGPAKQA